MVTSCNELPAIVCALWILFANQYPVGLLVVFSVGCDLDPFARQVAYADIPAGRFDADRVIHRRTIAKNNVTTVRRKVRVRDVIFLPALGYGANISHPRHRQRQVDVGNIQVPVGLPPSDFIAVETCSNQTRLSHAFQRQ